LLNKTLSEPLHLHNDTKKGQNFTKSQSVSA